MAKISQSMVVGDDSWWAHQYWRGSAPSPSVSQLNILIAQHISPLCTASVDIFHVYNLDIKKAFMMVDLTKAFMLEVNYIQLKWLATSQADDWTPRCNLKDPHK